MNITKYPILLLSVVIVAICGCDRDQRLPALSEIHGYVSDNPQKALESLDSINYNNLSAANRHFYDFLSIKAHDKAYVRHTSDSLILDVIDYYSTGNDDAMYAETLYYGGRVYSDLGDYPSSLNFFHKALDILPSDSDNLNLRANIVSQMGRLLNKLRIYDEACKYIQEAIDIDRQLNDTLNTVYDLQLLGSTYFRNDKYELAEQAFQQALDLSGNQPEEDRAKSNMYMAAIKYKCGDLDSALRLIRGTIDHVDQSLNRNYALGYAAQIYNDAGIADTAYMYAHEIVNSPNPGPLVNGYYVLLSPSVRNLISQDSVYIYLTQYVDLLEDYYNENEMQMAINRHSLYNYDIHERDKLKAQRSNERLTFWIWVLILLAFVLSTAVLYFKNRSKTRIIELHEAIETIKDLKIRLAETQRSAQNIPAIEESATPTPIDRAKNEDALREQLRKEMLALYEESKDRAVVPDLILQSDVYAILKEKIALGEKIHEDDSLWGDIEQVILRCSPNFMRNLNFLSAGRLNQEEIHTAFLIKFGLKPTSEMTILLGRAQGTIVSRRDSICSKILGEKKSVRVVDAIIRLL